MTALLLVLALASPQDSVRVQSSLTETEIRAGETTLLRVEVETDGPRASIERMTSLPPGIELISTRDFDQRQFSIPGGTRRFIWREFVLRARAPGRYRIPSVDIVVAGARHETRSHLLTVSGAPVREDGGRIEGPPGEVMLEAWLDSDTVFVGEQVTLQADAMFSQAARLRLRRAPEYEPPSPSGFWIQDIPDQRSSTTRTLGNEVYEVQTFRRALFPLSPGEYTIQPARLEYEMRRGLLYSPETFEVVSDPLPLVVLPVPVGDQPPEFTGAVGQYTVRGRLEPAEVPAGEATVLTVEVEGKGNIKALPPPRLPELEGIEVFPPTEDARSEVVSGEVRGLKRFSWVLIPREAGVQEIPPVRYAYFDPETGAYDVAEVGGMDLRVRPGSGPADVAPAAALRYLKTAPAGRDPLGWVESPWFLAAQLLPLLLLGAALAGTRRDRRGRRASRRSLRRRRRTVIRDLEQRARTGDPAFLGDAEAAARGWLAERLGLPTRECASRDSLRGAGVGDGTAAAVAAVIGRLAQARFAPAPPGAGERAALVESLGRVLERVDREAPLPRPAAGAGAGAAMAGLAFLALLPGAVAAQATEDPGAFAVGLERFDEARYLEAAEAFDRYVQRRPDDAAGWYNLGTAYHRAGFRGYAVWAWLHVPPLDPRDEDTRHNLRVAGAAPELVARVTPALPVRREELLLLAAIAWVAAAAAGSIWILRRRAWAGVVGSAAVLLAVATAAAAAASPRGADTLVVLEPAVLRAGPTLGGEPLAQLEPGAGLEAVSHQDGWVRVRTLRGSEGWIEARSAAALGAEP